MVSTDPDAQQEMADGFEALLEAMVARQHGARRRCGARKRGSAVKPHDVSRAVHALSQG